MNNIKDILREEAWKVRNWAESLPDLECDDLDCMCAICSTYLFEKLYDRSLSPIFIQAAYSHYSNESHCYVECCGYVVDVTATQFGSTHKPVTIFKTKYRRGKDWFWQREPDCTNEATTLSGIRKILQVWPYDQHPKKYNLLKGDCL